MRIHIHNNGEKQLGDRVADVGVELPHSFLQSTGGSS
jgi:hypothetical protein